MWHIPKPNLEETLDDVEEFARLGIITSAEIPALKQLVRDYDTQKANVTLQQLGNISSVSAKKIHDKYSETYAGKKLSIIRDDLFENIAYCPYCGINERGSLDHYMAKSTYQALALCRLNLVPMCMICNRLKSNRSSVDFINPYYFVNPGVEFFVCTISLSRTDVVFSFSIKQNALPDCQLTNSLINQISVVDLSNRLDKAVVSYLQEDIFSENDSPQLLIASLPSLIQKKEQNVKMFNHWKTAVLKGLDRFIKGNVSVAQQVLDALNRQMYY
ncbi:MAG: hypothetical protein HUK21_04550 [Fibrobacteraceae bacterium]|nr:hypothetical protein [Fibrobacteraceae bacterium]